MASRDNDSPSDPYVKVVLGDAIFDDRENFEYDLTDIDLYKSCDFEQVFPGCPVMKIQMWDYDMLFGDDLIGETEIDLEDRYFSPDYNAWPKKPIEYRQLYHPSSSVS